VKLSVVIPTFNRVDYLRQAIDSVIAQDYPDLEIIVADNASQDATPQLMAEYAAVENLIYRRNESNLGMVANWADAIENIASGDWFLIMSDDDYFTDPGYLSAAANMIARHPALTLVMSNGYILQEPSGIKTQLRLPFAEVAPGIEVFLSRDTYPPQAFTLCNVLFKRDLALKMAPFLNPDNISCDSELFLKLCLLGDVGVNQGFVSVYRVHGQNVLQSTETDAAVLLGGFDAFVKPYHMALSMLHDDALQCTDRELREWRARVLVGAARYILLHARLSHAESLDRITAELEASLPGIVEEARDSSLFRLKFAVIPLWRLLRRG